MLKYLLIIALIALLFGGGAARLRSLLGAGKNMRKAFDRERRRGEDPVAEAREIEARVIDRDPH